VKLRYFILRRVVIAVPVLIAVSVLTFVISHIVPGDPARLAAGPQASPEQIQQLSQEYGLDKPLPEQYLAYMFKVLKADLGRSMVTRHTVISDLARYFPATLELVVVSMVLAVVIGVILGVASAAYHDRWPDQLSRVFALGSISMPRFWLAIVLQLLLGQILGLIPIGGRFDALTPFPAQRTGLLLVDSLLAADLHSFGVALRHVMLPAFCQSLTGIALTTRVLRADMLEVMVSDFVLMARANGLPEAVVMFKYVLKNALIATVSMLGFLMAYSLGGSVFVETVFDWPGIGLYATSSALNLDFQPIMGVTLLVGIVFTVVNLLTDVTYGLLDPRIRYG
jgi:peptide/nickel transport system permease protein